EDHATQVIHRNDLIDQANAVGFSGVDAVGGVHDHSRVRLPNQRYEPVQAVEAVRNAQSRRGYAELAARIGDAQIRLHGQRQSAAQTIAADAGNSRFGKAVEGAPANRGLFVVGALRIGVGALLFELADVRA